METWRVFFEMWTGEFFLRGGIKIQSPFIVQGALVVCLMGFQSCSGSVTVSNLSKGVFAAEILSLFYHCMGATWDRKLRFLVHWSLDQKELYSYPLKT